MKKLSKRLSMLFVTVLCLVCMLSITAYAEVTKIPLAVNGDWVEGQVTTKDNPLYYSVTIPSDGQVTFYYQATAEDTTWRILSYDLTSEYYSSNIWNASPTNPKTDSKTYFLSAGTYVIKASAYDVTAGTIRVKVTHTPAGNAETEPNNEFATAMPLPASQQIKGALTHTDNLDFYRVSMPAEGPYKLELVATQILKLTIYRSDFTTVKSDNYYGGSPESPKTHTISGTLPAGDYYVKVERYSEGATGIYYMTFKNTAVQSITLNHTALTLKYNDTVQLTATVNPADAVSSEVEWSSSDPYIAYVGDDGTVTARGTGVATITATSKVNANVKATCIITIKPEQVSGLSQNKYSTKTTSLTFSWYSVSGADGYRVYKYDSSKKKYVKYKDTTKTSISVSKLKAETKYKFKVAAYVKNGSTKILGSQSAAITAFTAPKKLGATSITSIKRYKKTTYYNYITVKWKKVKGATGYKVYGKTSGGSWQLINTVSGCSTKLYAGRGYSYQIKVCAYRTKNGMTTDGSFSKTKKYTSK